MGSIGMSYSGVEEYGLLEGSLVFAEELGSNVGAVAVVDGENTMLRGREDVERISDYGLLGEGLMGVPEPEFSLGYPIAKGREGQESSTSSIRSFCSSTSTRESVFRGGSLYDTDVFSVTTGTPSLEEQGSQSIDSSVATTLVAGAVDPLMAYTGCAEMGPQVPYGQNQSPSMAFPTTLRSQGDAAQAANVMEQVHSAPQLQRQALGDNKPPSEQLRKVPRQRRCSRRASGTISSVYNNNTNSHSTNSQNNSNNSGNSPTHTSTKKVSDSRLSAQGLAEFLKLNSAEEALRRERFVLDILENELHYPLGYKTWVRDTSKKYRSQLLNLLHKRVRVKYPEYDKSVLETIIRRATYYMMQSRLRRERRAKAKCENSAKCNTTSQPISATCDKNSTTHLFGASVNALCQSERNPNLKPGHQGKHGENWCV